MSLCTEKLVAKRPSVMSVQQALNHCGCAQAVSAGFSAILPSELNITHVSFSCDKWIFQNRSRDLERRKNARPSRQSDCRPVMMKRCCLCWPARSGTMTATIEFKSHVPASQRHSLEALLFFNARQDRVSACIADAIEKFGAPEIVADKDRLRIHMRNMPEVQSLFAIDGKTGRPVGAAVYARQDVEHVTVMHVGVAAEFASGGVRANEQLLLRLLREVRRSTRRMKGVRRLELYYATGRGALRAGAGRWRQESKAAL